MSQFNLGDIVYHKATERRCVIKDFDQDGSICVTTENDEFRVYKVEELWTEDEWNKKNKNLG